MVVLNLIKGKESVPRGVWVKHPIIMISPNGEREQNENQKKTSQEHRGREHEIEGDDMELIQILEHPQWLEKNKEIVIVWEKFKGKIKIITRGINSKNNDELL